MIERFKILQLNTEIGASDKAENQDFYTIGGKFNNKTTQEHSLNYLSAPK